MPLTTLYHDAVLDAMLGTGHHTDFPNNLYAALFTADPGVDDTGTEVLTSGTNYSRFTVANTDANWSASSGGVKTLTTDIAWDTSTSSWGTVGWIGFYDAETVGTGDLVWSSTFSTGPRTAWPAVFSPKIKADTLTVSYWQLV